MADIAVALSLLSRLPVPLASETAQRRSAHAVWAYALVGAILAIIAGAAAIAMLKLGLDAGPIAAITLLILTLLTGGLHEDGLGDTADGLFGGRDKARALDIMRDSRVGAFAVIALTLFLLARWSAFVALLPSGNFIATLAFASMASRGIMGLAMSLLPPAREDGLSAITGTPPLANSVAGLVLSGAAGYLLLGPVSLLLMLAGLAAASLLWRFAMRKIGGQTGDILGATQLISETAMLSLATAQLL